MCGISGIVSSQGVTTQQLHCLESALAKLTQRGPDASGMINHGNVALGHKRLSIIDTSSAANQPLSDITNRYSIVFNGEIYNYREIRKELLEEGYTFRTESDTEVLIQAYARYGTAFLNKLNGFFALAIYDKETETTLLARDRFGIKPLIMYKNDSFFCFASEMKALMEFDIPREMDYSSFYTYFQLNYIPEPHSIFEGVKKLEPGHYLKVDKDNKLQKIPFYQIAYPPAEGYKEWTYEGAQEEFLGLLDLAVQRRLVADVPLGTFLSGGIDSSLITALASRHVKDLSTFSIGFSDKEDAHFDESSYALAVAKKYKTNHHVFSLSRQDLLGSLYESLDYIDEPFADSSALAVNALSKQTRKHVKVALSGDGADELFAGYHKHHGEFLMRKNGPTQQLVKNLKAVWGVLPKSRNSKVGNLIRKLDKFSKGASLAKDDRYWLWAGLLSEAKVTNLMVKSANPENYLKRKEQILAQIKEGNDFNDVLYTDVKLVLLSDMLRKVDMMSMANSLEVRTPFLDHQLVNFAFGLSADYKINQQMNKRIVQDAARSLLPEQLYNRPKQGFEVPLNHWMKNELNDLITNDLLSDAFIKEQNLFNTSFVKTLKDQLKSTNPLDSQANIWALIVFNSWWKKYMS